jgi:hypothetical protein
MAQRAHLGRAGLPVGLRGAHHEGRVRAVSYRHPGDAPRTPCAWPPLWAGPLRPLGLTPPRRTTDGTIQAMTNTPLVTRVDHHVHDVAQALDLASTALIRAQELADEDPTGAAPARLAQATAMLQGNLRMLADMLTSPLSPAAADAPPRGDGQRRAAAACTATTPPAAHGGRPATPVPEAGHGRA